MVIMENYLPMDQMRDLMRKIDHLHYNYLEMEETPEKLDIRGKLESVIEEFLSVVHPNQKFLLHETEDIFYKSALQKRGFSAYKASIGWSALQSYAGNLMAQSWRKEYRQIKTYCGFYKHHIEANLLGAEKLFEAMGYKHNGNGVLTLEGPVCPDQVADVSRDCLVAYVECQIMKTLYEEGPWQNMGWTDIIDFRRKYPGTLEQNLAYMKYNFHPEPVQEVNVFQPTSPMAQMSMPGGYNCMLSSTNNRHAPIMQQAPICCKSGYGTYTYMPCPSHMISQTMQPPPIPKGYFYGNTLPSATIPPPMYSVPTAQLIQLDTRNEYDAVDGAAGWTNRQSRTNSSVGVEPEAIKNGELLKNGFETLVDEKHNAKGDWDYVYRNLEKQGYSKDLGERGDILASSSNDKPKRHSKEPKKIKMTNLDEVLNAMSVNDRPLKITEALEKMDQKPIEKLVNQRERRHSHGSFYENVTSNDTPRSSTMKPGQTITTQTKTIPKEKSEKVTQIAPILPEGSLIKQKEIVKKWECRSCTFLNDYPRDICKMCSKTWNVCDEKPIEVGGAECTRCTLVNPKSAKTCQACNGSLKNSPTYI